MDFIRTIVDLSHFPANDSKHITLLTHEYSEESRTVIGILFSRPGPSGGSIVPAVDCEVRVVCETGGTSFPCLRSQSSHQYVLIQLKCHGERSDISVLHAFFEFHLRRKTGQRVNFRGVGKAFTSLVTLNNVSVVHVNMETSFLDGVKVGAKDHDSDTTGKVGHLGRHLSDCGVCYVL